jgi:hypothetical protein
MAKYHIKNKNGDFVMLHDVDNYQRAMQAVRGLGNKISSLEGEVSSEEVKKIARDLSQGILDVTSEIYGPLVDQEKKALALSKPNDYKTDFEEMQAIPRKFE